jgi:hypothetical protein
MLRGTCKLLGDTPASSDAPERSLMQSTRPTARPRVLSARTPEDRNAPSRGLNDARLLGGSSRLEQKRSARSRTTRDHRRCRFADCRFGLPPTLSSRGVTALHPSGNPEASATLRRGPVRSRAQRQCRSAKMSSGGPRRARVSRAAVIGVREVLSRGQSASLTVMLGPVRL